MFHCMKVIILCCCFLLVPVVSTSIVGTSTSKDRNQNYDEGTIMMNVNNDNYQYFQEQQPLHSVQIQYLSPQQQDADAQQTEQQQQHPKQDNVVIPIFTQLKLFLSPKQFPSLCGNITNTSINNNNNMSSSSSSTGIQDSTIQHSSKLEIGLVISSSDIYDTTTCTLQERLANVEYMNLYYLSSSFYYIQYLLIDVNYFDTNYNNGTISDTENTTTTTTTTTILYASNTTIDTIQLSMIKYVDAISNKTKNDGTDNINMSPYLLDNGYSNWNVEYIVTNVDEKLRQQQQLFGGGGYNSTSSAMGAISFAIFNLIFLLCIVVFIARAIRKQQQRLIESGAYGPTTTTTTANGTTTGLSTIPLGFLYSTNVSNQMEHQRQLQQEQYNNQIIHRLTEDELDVLPELKYEKGLYDKLKHCTIVQLQQEQKQKEKIAEVTKVVVSNNSDMAPVSSSVQVNSPKVLSDTVTTTTIPTLVDGENIKNNNSSTSNTGTSMFRNMITGLTTSSSSSPRRFATNNDKQQDTMTMANSNHKTSVVSDFDVEEGNMNLDDSTDTTDRNSKDICPICIDDFTTNECVIILPRCSHIYHKECLRQWLLNKDGRCPTCKVYVLTDEQIQSRSKQ